MSKTKYHRETNISRTSVFFLTETLDENKSKFVDYSINYKKKSSAITKFLRILWLFFII